MTQAKTGWSMKITATWRVSPAARRRRRGAAGWRGCSSRASTAPPWPAAPGCARCRPETMTWSPAASPLLTIQSLPSRAVGVDVLARDLAVLADDEHVGALRVALHRELRHRYAVALLAQRRLERDEDARQQRWSGLGTRARNATAPVAGSTTSPEKSSVPGCRRRCRRAAAPALRLLAAAVAGLRAPAPISLDAHREFDVQRIDLVDGGQQRRVALPDQRAFGHLLLAGAAADRRAHGGVAEVDARALDRRLAGLHRGGGAALGGMRVVEVGLRDELLRRQLARALRGGMGVGVGGLRRAPARPRPGRARPAAAPDRSGTAPGPSRRRCLPRTRGAAARPATRARTSALRYGGQAADQFLAPAARVLGCSATTPTSGGGMPAPGPAPSAVSLPQAANARTVRPAAIRRGVAANACKGHRWRAPESVHPHCGAFSGVNGGISYTAPV